MYDSGMSYRRITKHLNKKGILTHKGHKWSITGNSVYSVLKRLDEVSSQLTSVETKIEKLGKEEHQVLVKLTNQDEKIKEVLENQANQEEKILEILEKLKEQNEMLFGPKFQIKIYREKIKTLNMMQLMFLKKFFS